MSEQVGELEIIARSMELAFGIILTQPRRKHITLRYADRQFNQQVSSNYVTTINGRFVKVHSTLQNNGNELAPSPLLKVPHLN